MQPVQNPVCLFSPTSSSGICMCLGAHSLLFMLKKNPKITTPASGELLSLGRLLFGDMFSWRYCHRQHISRLSSSPGLYNSFLPRQCSMLFPSLCQHNCLWVCTMIQMKKPILHNSKELQKLFCFSYHIKEVQHTTTQKLCSTIQRAAHENAELSCDMVPKTPYHQILTWVSQLSHLSKLDLELSFNSHTQARLGRFLLSQVK